MGAWGGEGGGGNRWEGGKLVLGVGMNTYGVDGTRRETTLKTNSIEVFP